MFGTTGIYDNPDDTGDESERNVHIEYFDPDDPEETFHIAGGMRIHGGNGRRHAKKSIRLYFRSEYGQNRLDYDFYPDSPVKSFKRLLLRAGGHDGWTFTRTWAEASFMRNEFLHALQLAMDQPSPRGKLVHVYLNGAYWGFYALQELPHADYHADHHGGEKLDWDVIKHGNFTPTQAEDGDIAAWNTLMSRTASPITTEVAYDQVLEYIDVDNFIDAMIHRIWSSDEDWLGPQYHTGSDISRFHNKNWYAARKSRNGIQPFRFYCWDAEMSMGVSIQGLNRSYQHDLSRVDDSDSPGQIYDALRGYAPFQTRFGDRLQQHFFNDGPYTPDNLAVIWDSLSNLVQTAIIPESARWGDGGSNISRATPYTKHDQWKPATEWVSNTYLPLRSNEALNHFRAQGLYPAVDAPTFNPIGGLFNDPGTTLVITPPAGLGTVYYTRDGNDPMILDASSSSLELVEESSAVQALVPSITNGGAILGTSWHQVADPLNLASWKTGINGVGYETSTGYEAYINLDVLEMRNQTGSCFIRIPFSIPNAITLASISALTLNMRFDDGYTAYINGTQIATENAPAIPTWSSLSTTHHNDSEAIFYEAKIVSAHINQLVVGDNMLAIQAFNRDLTSSDLLIMAKLSAQTSSGSDIHPSAAPYTAPLDVTSSETIKARFRSNTGVWSALVEGEYIVGVPADSNRVTVTEIMYHPDDAFTAAELAASTVASDFEFIEILNLHAQTVDLSDCSFSQGITFNFPDGYFLDPGQRALIVNNQAAFTARYGGHYVDQIVGEFESDSKLSDAGERLTLVDGNLVTIFSVRYRDDSGWPDVADGTGNSLVQVDPFAGLNLDDLAQWRASYSADGRPGSDDILDFSSWASVQFNREQLDDPLVSGVLATPLGESLNNLVRYSFAYDLAPTHPLLNPFGTNGVLGVSYRSRTEIPDVAFVPYVSGDLETWNQNSPGDTHIIIHSEQDLGDGTRNTIMLDTVPDAIRHLRMNLEYTPTP